VDTAAPILIVEDDDLVRSFLARALTGVSDRIDACGTGAEATRAVRGTRYGAILLDGLLPDIHGVDLGRQLVRLPEAARSGICFVSGSLRRASPLRSGVSALPKPLRLRELTDAVSQLLLWHESAADSVDDRLAALDGLAADLLVG
jgi:two-component system cell cycle response regulator CpdR